VRRQLLAVLAAVLLAAPAAVAALADGGWSRRTLAAAGVSIAAPAGWLNVSSAGEDRSLALTTRLDPALAPYVQLARSSGALKLLLLAPAGFPNMSVTETLSPGLSLAQVVHLNVLATRSLPFVGAISSSLVTLPAGRAVRLRYTIALAGSKLTETQYLLLRLGRLYVLSYTGSAGAAALLASLASRSAASLRFLGRPIA